MSAKRQPLWPRVVDQIKQAGDGTTAAAIARGINLSGKHSGVIVTARHVAACCTFYLQARGLIESRRERNRATVYYPKPNA